MRALVALASPTHDDESVGLCIQVLIQVSPVKQRGLESGNIVS